MTTTRKEDLPDGARVLSIERGPFVTGHGQTFRAVLFDVDGDTGAFSCTEIVECETVGDAVSFLFNRGSLDSDAWLPVEVNDEVQYFQPGGLTLAKAAEKACGVPAMKSRVYVSPERELINAIRGALGTEEDGEALVEVARDAHRAEQELAAMKRKCDGVPAEVV